MDTVSDSDWPVELLFGYTRSGELINILAKVDVDGDIHRVDMAWPHLLMPAAKDFLPLQQKARMIVTARLNGNHEWERITEFR